MDNLLKDTTDGSALAALIHFYCPQVLPLEGEETQISGSCVGLWEAESALDDFWI